MAYLNLNVTFGQGKTMDDIDLIPMGKDDTTVGPARHVEAGANEVGHVL